MPETPEIPDWQKANNEKMADEMVYLAGRVRRGELWWRYEYSGTAITEAGPMERLRVLSLCPEKPKGF